MCHMHEPSDGIDPVEVRCGVSEYELVVLLAVRRCTYVPSIHTLG